MMAETAFEYLTDDNYMAVSTSEKKMVRKLMSMIEKHKDECCVRRLPEENGGYLYCLVPKTWLSIRVPKKRTMTEEQKQEVGDRLAKYRKRNVQA